MPLTIPTYYALKFIKNQSLQQRIYFLQRSYQVQIAAFFTFNFYNFRKDLRINQDDALLGLNHFNLIN